MIYDYIIIGAGAAGLQLAAAMGHNPFFKDKTVLLIDKNAKQSNDRTWCFWEKGGGNFDTIVHHRWPKIHIAGQYHEQTHAIVPYIYKMVRGLDFYKQFWGRISYCSHVQFVQETVVNVTEEGQYASVHTANSVFKGKQVFNSILDYRAFRSQHQYPVLQQHFLGWFIKTTTPVFDADRATFMDFSVPQKNNTRFMYVLPFSKTEALVEYTLFSEQLLSIKEYGEAIESYLKEKFHNVDYTIMDIEKGSIPMTSYNFASKNTERILHVGTAGGWTKASTGYTFRNTTKKVRTLIQLLVAGKDLKKLSKKTKFWYYDLLLLDVLHQDNGKGHLVFESLFQRKNPQLILKFLDEETTLWEDFQIILACPKKPFIKAFFRRLV